MTDAPTSEPPTARRPPRRTNADRSATTRRRLLDATVESLAEVGWARTSTTEVVRRAGVSRGAQVHHYPTKEDLVLAAVEHLLARREAEYATAFDDLPAEQRSPQDALRLLRQGFLSDTFDAWLELLVAARTDPALHARFTEVDEAMFDRSAGDFERMFPELTGGDHDVARAAVGLAFTVHIGLAVRRLAGAPDADVDQTLDLVASLVEAALSRPADQPNPATDRPEVQP